MGKKEKRAPDMDPMNEMAEEDPILEELFAEEMESLEEASETTSAETGKKGVKTGNIYVQDGKYVKDKTFRCPLCGATAKGKRGLNIHLRRTHFPSDDKSTGWHVQKKMGKKKDWSRKRFDKRNELKIQEVLVRAVYGSAKVADVVKKYINGEYTLRTLPINISYYIRLKGYKPNKKKEEERPAEKKGKSVPENEVLTVGRFLKELQKRPDGDQSKEWKSTVIGIKIGEDSFQYILDCIYNDSEEVLKITSGIDVKDSATSSELITYFTKFEPDENRSGYAVVHGRSTARRVISKEDDLDRWVVVDFTDKEKEEEEEKGKEDEQ